MTHRKGFTLVEVLVALVVGSVVLLMAERVLAALSDQSSAIVSRNAEWDRESNGEGFLRALVGQLEIGAPGTIPFSGGPDTVRFSSWCEVPAGWLEHCTVTLAFRGRGNDQELVAAIDDRAVVSLERGIRNGGFRYLESAAAGGQWFQRWGTGITVPLGIGIVGRRGDKMDTMIVRIGTRG
ncbi:MAG TPA: prepilin-type N-terminal cleavage/methylation domain-containing protein [Gemmatimonadaceae bacterium]|jgi:prepilin-type N-terminal cleavage/methylation domain-containing protein